MVEDDRRIAKEFSPSLSVPRRTILSPGPSSANPRVLQALSQPIVGYLDPWYFDLIDATADMLALAWRTRQRTFVVSGSGSAGMEAGLVNLGQPDDTVIICSYGYFCERQVDMARRLGFNVVPIHSPWGRQMPPDLLEDALRKHPGTRLVSAIHAETSVGVLQDVKTLASIAHRYGALFMVDCVTSLGGCPLEFDEWDLDYAYSGSQKCLAAPPGLSPAAISERAYDYVSKRKHIPSWYLDLRLIANYWGSEHIPHHTSSVSMVYALHEALTLLMREGMEQRWQRHASNAAALRAGLEALGLELLVNPEDRLDQLTIVRLPDTIDDADLRLCLLEHFGIEIGRGLGEFAGKVIRIGLMGESCNPANVFALLSALERILPSYGYEISPGEGVGAAGKVIASEPVRLHHSMDGVL